MAVHVCSLYLYTTISIEVIDIESVDCKYTSNDQTTDFVAYTRESLVEIIGLLGFHSAYNKINYCCFKTL